MVDKLSSNMDKSQRKVIELKLNVAKANKELENTERISNRLTRSVGKLAVAFAIKELVANVTKVRGQFQQLEVAFTTMLQSAEKADALMQQLTKTAATTPFGLEDVAQGAKQLLAYGFEAEKVNETLIRLGDIAAGLSVPLNDLVYLYGTTMAQGRMYTQDLNQFTNRGIPMIAELAKQFGVTESKVRELVEAGKVGFPEVQKVIESLTNEGGKFGGLMEEQSKTITGQISNIEDSISMMFNELGQQSEGIINTTLSGISYVIEHYERFGRILLGLVATYGTYRTAIMLVTAAKGWATAAEALHYNWLLLVEKAQKMLNATMLANPYVLVATLIAGVVVAMVSMKTEAERMKEADEAYEEQKQKVIEAEEEHKRRLEELARVAGDEALSTDTRREALNKLEQKYPDIFAKYDTEIEKLKNIKKIKEEIAALDGQKSITRPENEVKNVNKRIAELEKKGAATYAVQSTTWGGYNYQNGGRTKDEEAELKSLYRRRDGLNEKIRKNSVNSYFENLTGVSNETLEQQIKQRENLLARMTTNEKKYGTITQGDSNLTGTYSRDELQYQLNKLRAEKNERNAPRNSGSGWASKAKKDYDKALKAYNDFVSDKTQDFTETEFEKRRKELKDDLDQKKKEYDKVKPSKDSDSDKAAKQHQKEQAEAERRKQTQEKLGQELAELQRSNDAAEIETMQEGLQKKLREIENEYQQRKNAIDKQESNWKRDNVKAGIATGDNGLTADQTVALQEARKQAEAIREKEIAEANKEAKKGEIEAMVEYLKEYGSYQQQKLAIAEEYAQKIADVEASEADEATKQWQKKKLNKERLQKEASLSFENISRGIDWHALFSGVGDLTKEMMAPMMEQLQAWVKTDEYSNADAETQQKVTDLIQEMRKYVGTDQSVTWQALDKAIKDFTQAVARYDEAKKAEDAAVLARNEGKKKLDAGEITADEYKALEQRAQELGGATAQAREDMEAFGGALNRTSEEVANFTSGLTTALSNAKGWTGADGFGNIQNAAQGIDQLKGTLDSLLPQMGDGMAKTIGTTLSSTIGSTLGSIGSGIEGLLGSGLGSIIGIVAQIPKLILDLAGAIKNFVTGILDALTELISLRWIDDLVVSILDAVGNLIDAIFDLPENLFKVLESIVVNGVGGLLDGVIGRIGNILTFGALSSSVSDWFTNSNAAEVAATIDRLTKRNELLEQAIEDLTDEMKSARGARAIDASTRARQLQEETNANYKSIAQAQAGYHSAHHSWNYYWDGFSQEQIARLSGQIGRQWNGDLWNLSPEEMKMLRSNVDMWKLIADTGKGSYGESVQEKLSAYIDQAGKLQEITDALYENLTTTTKENVFDDFLGSLYDLADGSEDVMDNIADNWQKMVNRMAVNNLVGAKFQKDLEDWYENLAKLNEARTNGEITDEEYRKRLDALKAEYDGYVESAKRDIETLRTGGIVKATEENSGVTQSGKAGAFTTMSQDQAGKLEGLFVSGQMHWASMDDKLTDVTRQMDEVGDHLRQIATNTGSSAQSLGEIKEDIKKMIRDGLKMK